MNTTSQLGAPTPTPTQQTTELGLGVAKRNLEARGLESYMRKCLGLSLRAARLLQLQWDSGETTESKELPRSPQLRERRRGGVRARFDSG